MSGSLEQISEQVLPYALDAIKGFSEAADAHRRFGFGPIGNVALVLAAGLMVDDVLARRTTRGAEPHVTLFPAEHGASERVLTVYGGGFNSCSSAAANIYRPAATQFGHMIALTDPASGYDRAANNRKVSSVCRELDTEVVVLLGDSMRTLKHLPLARHLKEEEGLEVRVMPVCSPLGIRHVKGRQRLIMLGALDRAYRLGVRGGPALRVLIETAGYALDHIDDPKGMTGAIGHALRKSKKPDMPTNPQVLLDAGLLRRYDGSDDLRALHDVPFAYIRPENPDNDKVVETIRARDDMQAELDEQIIDLTSPRIGHANPCDFPVDFQLLAARGYRGFGLRSARQRLATVHI